MAESNALENVSREKPYEDPDGFGESPSDDEDVKPSTSKDQLHLEGVDTEKEISIVLAGKSGAGKTTLMRTLFDLEEDTDEDTKILSADHLTMELSVTTVQKHGVTIKVTDTVGLEGGEQERKRQLRKLSRFTGGKADLLVYCLSVDPAVKFKYANPDIMKSLQEAFGTKIWEQCLVVLTFSNSVWDRLNKKMKKSTKDDVICSYKLHLLEYATLFCKELEKLKIQDVTVKVVFDFSLERVCEERTILAIPAGEDPDDQVLPDFEPMKVTNTTSDQAEHCVEIPINDWRSVLIMEMVRKSRSEHQKSLLQYYYGPGIIAKTIVQGTKIGSVLFGIKYAGPLGGALAGAKAGVKAIAGLELGNIENFILDMADAADN